LVVANESTQPRVTPVKPKRERMDNVVHGNECSTRQRLEFRCALPKKHPRVTNPWLSTSLHTATEVVMHKPFIGLGLAMMASLACASGVENKWRLQFSGGAESDGRIVLELAPAEGEPLRAVALIRKGRSENGVARDVSAALQAQAGKRYNVEVDDGEDVLVKKHDGERKFVITIVENSVRGVRIEPDAE
jgi:hypothetical protein